MDVIVSIVTWVTAIAKDDIWIGKIYKLIDMLAINVGKAKEVSPKK